MNLDLLRHMKQLGQSAPSDTSNTTLYAPVTGVLGIVFSIHVVNTSGDDATYRIFQDADGSTASKATVAAGYDTIIGGDHWELIEFRVGVPIVGTDSGTLVVRSDTADALTFTAYGIEINSNA